MWDHFGSQALRSAETLNAENKILKEIVARQRKKLLLLARQISQIESKSKSKRPSPVRPASEISSPQEPATDISSQQESLSTGMESPKTLVTEDDNACSIVAVEVKNRRSDMTEIPKTANVDFGKAVESLDTDGQKGRKTPKKRPSDTDSKTEQPSKKRRSSRKSKSNADIEEIVSTKITEKKNAVPLARGSPPKIRRSSRTIRQKSPEIGSKGSTKINSTSDKKEIKPDEKQLKEIVCRWQKKDGTGNCNQECAKTFGTLNALQKHLQSHVPSWVSENASYICFWNGCKQNQKAYAGRMQLLTHFSKNHAH